MKVKKLLILGILSIIGLSSYSFADFIDNGYTYDDGIYWSSGRELITVIAGEYVWTMQDKNVGATEVYDGTINSLGTPDINSMYSVCSQLGNFYQFGNNHPFSCDDVLHHFSDIPTFDYDGTTIYSWDSNPLNSSSLLYSNTSSFYYYEYVNNLSDSWGAITNTTASRQNMCPDGFSIPLSSDWSNIFRYWSGTEYNGYATNFQPMRLPFNYSTSEWAYYLKMPYYSRNEYRIGIGLAFWGADPIGMLSAYGNLYTQVPLNINIYNGYNEFTPSYAFSTPSLKNIYKGNYGNQTVYTPLTNVRCFKNTPVLPDNTWVALTGSDTSTLPDPAPDEPEIPDGGDGTGYSDLVPVYSNFEDPNVQILESAIWCYMTSGLYYDGTYQTGGCDWGYSSLIDSFGLVSGSVYWSESLKYGNISFSPSSNVLNYYCLSPYASYSFCDNLDLYNNTYIVYSVMSEGSGPDRLMYNIFGSGVSISIDNLGSGHLSGLNCNGVWCDNYNVSVPEYVYTGVVSDSGVVIDGYLGYYIDTGYYNVLNGNRFFFNCPYSYSGNYFNFDNKIIDWLGGTKLGNVIGCPITAFVYGRRQLLFKDFESGNEYWDGYLFGNLSSSQAKAMYTFFDIILSLIILVLFQKLYHLIFK